MDLADKSVVVIGLSKSGRAAARLAVAHGACVVGMDTSADVEPVEGVTLQLGPHHLPTILSADLVIVSPGVPAGIAPLREAVAQGVVVVGELGFAAQFVDAPIIAVTGTNGKSTVTSFVGDLLKGAGYEPFVGGNLGVPLSAGVLDTSSYDVLVVEVSSYQMEFPFGFHPKIAVVLNLTPDHLKRHGDIENYGRHKLRLFDHMEEGDVAILPANDEVLCGLYSREMSATIGWIGAMPGVVLDDAVARIGINDREVSIDLSALTVAGLHNRENAAVAAYIACAFGLSPEKIQATIGLLEALPHRMQTVGTHQGVHFINDSKATNVEAALAGIAGTRDAVVMLGGQAKGGGFGALVDALGQHKSVVTFGASGDAIAEELTLSGYSDITRTRTMEDAFMNAVSVSESGGTVLLSPGCASFDEFDNFEHRGDRFIEWFGRLK